MCWASDNKNKKTNSYKEEFVLFIFNLIIYCKYKPLNDRTASQLHHFQIIYFFEIVSQIHELSQFNFDIFVYCLCFKVLKRIMEPAMINTQPIPI